MTPFAWLVVLCGGLIMTVSMGVRQIFGLFLAPMTVDLGLGRETFAFALALQQLLFGAFQPFCGMVADRYGAGRVLTAGAAAYFGGLAIMGYASTAWQLDLGAGLLVGFAQAATGFAVVLGALGRMVAPEKRSLALGLASAGGSFGQFVMAPVGQQLIQHFGWSAALLVMAAVAAVMAPLALALRGRAGGEAGGMLAQSLSEALAEASRHSGFWYLNAGFFVCGFHLAFIGLHLPAFLVDLGFTAGVGAAALAIIGFSNIVGTYACGVLGGRYSKKYLLSALYALRALVFALFVLMPKSEISVYLFSVGIGMLWLGTVPLTSELIAQIFGVRYMGTLFGLVFFSHQVGSFLGVWLAGRVFDATGTYDAVWLVVIALGLAAALLHLPIADRPLHPVLKPG